MACITHAIALALLLSLPAPDAAAQTTLYKCADKWGQPIFSQRPCGDDATTVSVVAPPESGTEAPADSSAMTVSRQIRERERSIKYLEDRIDRYEVERGQKLRALENKARYANNNLAGAQYRESLATEMQSVNAEYSAKISTDEKKLELYRNELYRLLSSQAAGSGN